MKTTIKLLGIIALVAVIGFSLIACGSPGGGGSNSGGPGSGNGGAGQTGQFTGKDVLSNSYSLSIGSNASASRSAAVGDRYSMNVTTRNGTTRTSRGSVTAVNSVDGTVTLKPDGAGEAFSVVTSGSNIGSVTGTDDMGQITFTNGEAITPRSFDQINLRANRWDNGNGVSGEGWGSGLSVLVKDFPTNLSRLYHSTKWDTQRYTITLSGISDVNIDHLTIGIQGLTNNDEWQWFGDTTPIQIAANTQFEITRDLDIYVEGGVGNFHDLLKYKEIILEVVNVMKYTDTANPDQNKDNGEIPANIPNDQILATISNFNISLKDKTMSDLKGNLGDFSFGIKEDGMSLDYMSAVWNLKGTNLATAKQGANFEFAVLEGGFGGDGIPHAKLAFIWQDPVRGLWWQDQTLISDWDTAKGEWVIVNDSVTWDPQNKKYTINLPGIIKDSQFNDAQELNFIIACWGFSDQGTICIDALGVTGANISIAPTPTAGNIGNYRFGAQEDGITPSYGHAVWHLTGAALATAKTSGSKLEIVLQGSIPAGISAALVYGDIDNQRWWEGQTEIYGEGVAASGVTFNSGTRTLSIVLSTVFGSNYSDFQTVNNANLVFAVWWPHPYNVNDLRMVSANIVP
jgi:hypothetical protein